MEINQEKLDSKTIEALIKVQQSISDFTKKEDNPFFKSKYVPLPELLKNIKPILNLNNFLLIQQLENDQLITRIIHSEGGQLKSIAPIKLDEKEKNNPQKYGSAITYMRRYSLTALLGIAEFDDDGNAASNEKSFNNQLADVFSQDEIETIFNWLKQQLDSCQTLAELEHLKLNKDFKRVQAKLKKQSSSKYQEFANLGTNKNTFLCQSEKNKIYQEEIAG